MSAHKIIGHVVGETTHSEVEFTAKEPPKVGQYVFIPYTVDGGERLALAMVESSRIGNPLLSYPTVTPEFVEKIKQYAPERTEYIIGVARILSWVDTLLDRKEAETPKMPPKPGTPVYEASEQVLSKIFGKRSKEDGRVKLGWLANHPGVEVYVDVDSIVSRHLAILAVTGAGKSNTVFVLVDRIVNELGGTVVLFDLHNEYDDVAGENTKIIEPKIHPSTLTLGELYGLLGLDENATKQRIYLKEVYNELEEVRLKRPHEFLREISKRLKSRLISSKSSDKSLDSLYLKFESFMEDYGETIISVDVSPNLTSIIEPGKANVFRLGSVGVEVADVIAYHYLDRLLYERKRFVAEGSGGYPVPVLAVLEEAHILLPRDRSTLTKEVTGRIAREGRKFGVGLCLVSQRPKKLDDDALSQANNKIVMRLVEPQDQRYVQAASETLSDELLRLLPSLNIGEAIILGMMTPIPALVKIEKAEKKRRGGDIFAHKEWAEKRRGSEQEKTIASSMIM